MRVLFTCRPLHGHFHPLVPLARTAVAAGHEVAFATAAPFAQTVKEAGFTAFTAGAGVERPTAEFVRQFGVDQLLPTEQRPFFFGRVFTGFEMEQRTADLVAIAGRWAPDVIVHDLAEFAGPLAAALSGVPSAMCGLGPLVEPEIAELAGRAVARYWEAAGLDPAGGRLYGSLYLDRCPPSLQAPEIADIPNVCQVRPQPAEPNECEPIPPWLEGLLDRLLDRPTVYVTFGTVFNRDRALTGAVLNGLARKPWNVIVTLGPGADVERAGRIPDNVQLCSYVPQSQLIKHCDAVVCHGGIGSMLGALAAGLPVLALPRGADHFHNAERLLAAGAGRRLLDEEITAEAVAAEVARLLTDQGLRQSAAGVAAEIAAMPPPASAIAALEDLAGKRRGPRPGLITSACALSELPMRANT